MPFATLTILICLFLAVYLVLVFFALPRTVMRMLADRPQGNPGRSRSRIKSARVLLPAFLTLGLLLPAFADPSGLSWLERYLREANQGKEWALLLILGEILALAGFLGRRLVRIEKELLERAAET
jgi:hypothetical protein